MCLKHRFGRAGMKKAIKLIAVLFLIFVVAPVVYSAFDHYTTWYFTDFQARLAVDGKPAGGRIHRDRHGRSVFVTRTDVGRTVTYLIAIPGNTPGYGSFCRDWVAPRFPAFSIGDLNPPCWTFTSPGDPNPPPVHPPTNLVTGPNFVEFTAYDGKRVRATW